MTNAVLFFQADQWRGLSANSSEITWESGYYPNDEQWVRLQYPDKPAQRLTILAGFHDQEPLDRQVMRLLLVLESARRTAEFIHLFMPFMPYSLQDRDFQGGNAVAARLMLRMIESVGVDKVTLVDIHNPKFMSEWRIPAVDLSALRLLADRIQATMEMNNLAVVAPDKGAIPRANAIGEYLHAPVYLLEKERRGPGDVIVRGNLLACPAKHLLLIDDMINTGGTMAEAAKIIREQCGAKVSVAAVHPLCAGKAIDKLRGAGVTEIFVTNSYLSWPLRPEANLTDFYVADVSLLLPA